MAIIEGDIADRKRIRRQIECMGLLVACGRPQDDGGRTSATWSVPPGRVDGGKVSGCCTYPAIHFLDRSWSRSGVDLQRLAA